MNQIKVNNVDKTQEINVQSHVTTVYPELEDLEVVPTNKDQSFKSSKYGYDNVLVHASSGAGTSDYKELDNLPSINNVPLIDNKTLEDLGIDQDFIKDSNYVHTDNNYTTTEKNKLAGLSNYDDTALRQSISNLQINKADKTEIPDVSNFITKDVNNLTNYTLKTSTGSLIDLEINNTTYVVTLKLKTQDGTVISTDTIDLPLESVVVGGNYDSTNKKIVLTLENGNTVDIPVGDLIAGLQTEITSQNKLASDLVDDTNNGNKFVTTSEKQTWNNKYDKPIAGIPKTDLTTGIQTSLGKADSAVQLSDLTDYATKTYVDTKIGDIDTALQNLVSGNGVV